eukprot:Nitzschia sp. Nitz4//scaffold196_size54656//1975//3387//NITZ4_006628-RA/size54656-processed-gene-0.57-mRNA-1//-1//CDS//3329540393//4432//frame0
MALFVLIQPSMRGQLNMLVDTKSFLDLSYSYQSAPTEATLDPLQSWASPSSPPTTSKPEATSQNVETSSTDDEKPSEDESNSLRDTLSSYQSATPFISPPTNIDLRVVVDISTGLTLSPGTKALLDGLERSEYVNVIDMTFLTPYLQTVQVQEAKPSNPSVYLIDWGSMNRDCHRLERVLHELGRTPEHPMLLLDYTGSIRHAACSFFDDNTRLAKRSIVEGRYYHPKEKKLHQGRIIPNEPIGGGPMLHAPLLLRERFAEAIANHTQVYHIKPLKNDRTKDVCFFWKPADYSHYGFWRRDVSKTISSLSKYSTHVQIAAEDLESMEMGAVQLEYVQALLDCKIVVVAQRDEWEDHYRLYESLASGAMVLTDNMLSLPEGLRNASSLVVYDTVSTLRHMLEYYLDGDPKERASIAKKGMELVLGRFRSWHRVEQLLFGQPLTSVDQPYEEAPAKQSLPNITLRGRTDIMT